MHYITTKTLTRIKILLLAGTIAIVAIVLIDAFSNNSQQIGYMGRKGSKNSKIQQEEFKKADELLHAVLWQLQDMDQRFASLLTTQNDQGGLEKTNASIQYTEEAFRKSIDSIARIGSAYDEETGTNDFQNMTTFFKKILENRRFIAFTRMGVISGGGGNATEKQTILRLQNELYEKDRMIASSASNKTVISLQGQLDEKGKQVAALETEKQGLVQTTQKLQGELAEKDKMIASLGSKNTSTADQRAVLNLQKEIAAKNKQISDLQTQSQSEKQNYTQTIQKLQTEVSEKNKTIAASNKKLPADQKALASLQNEINVKNKQISDLQKQSQSEKQTSSQAIQKLQGEVSEKNKTIAAISNKKLPADQKGLASLQNEINVKNKQISDLQTQVQKEQSERKTYSQTIQKFENDLAQKSKMIDALSNIKIPTDDKAIASLQKEIGTKNKQISDLQTELNEKNKAIASASNNKLPADQKGLTSLQNELSAKNKQISTLQAEIRKEQTEKQNYSQTISEMQLELIEKNKIIAAAGNRKVPADQKALVTLQNEIAEKDRRIKRLEQQLQNGSVAKYALNENSQANSDLRLAYNNTMTQLGVLQKKYNTLKAEMDQLRNQR